MVGGFKEQASAHDDAKSTAQRTSGQSVKHNWDSSKDGKRRRGGRGRLAKMRTSWKCRKTESSSLEANVMQKVPELVAHERMSQNDEVRGTK